MELATLLLVVVPVVFGVLLLVVLGIVLAVLVPAAKRKVDADFEERRREREGGRPRPAERGPEALDE